MREELFTEVEDLDKRKACLADNADGMEEVEYHKDFTEAELNQKKDKVIKAEIEIAHVQEKAKNTAAWYRDSIKRLQKTKENNLTAIQLKGEDVKENCYKYVDRDNRITGYYNDAGKLVKTRPAKADELQAPLFQRNVDISDEEQQAE